jgi:hypothetical protein
MTAGQAPAPDLHPRGNCPVCGRPVQLRVRDHTGTYRLAMPLIARHTRMARGGSPCPGLGRPAKADG